MNAIALGAPAPNYVGIAQSLAFACALAILLLWRGRGALMSAADFSKVAAATILMGLVLWPLRSMEPGVAALAAQVAIGLAIYGACVAAFDIAGLRTMFAQALKSALRRS